VSLNIATCAVRATFFHDWLEIHHLMGPCETPIRVFEEAI
jgi:hypothetical protein